MLIQYVNFNVNVNVNMLIQWQRNLLQSLLQKWFQFGKLRTKFEWALIRKRPKNCLDFCLQETFAKVILNLAIPLQSLDEIKEKLSKDLFWTISFAQYSLKILLFILFVCFHSFIFQWYLCRAANNIANIIGMARLV